MRGCMCRGRARAACGRALPRGSGAAEVSARYRTAHLTADLPCNVDHGIIGLMDPAHGPFVHQAWWWRSRASIREKTKQFEPIPEGFRMSAHAPRATRAPYKLLGVYGQPMTTTIDFVLPNRRYEMIRCGDKWFSQLTTVTPVTASTCRIDVIAAWNVFYWVPFLTPIAKFFGAKFVRQDQETMIQQARGAEAQSQPDADRRRGQAGEVVLRAEAGAAGGDGRASAGWAGEAALAELRLRGCGLAWGVRLGEGIVPTRPQSARTDGAPEAFMLAMTAGLARLLTGVGLVLCLL